MGVDRVLLDTSVLIAAIDTTRRANPRARALIESDPRALYVTGQNLREFLAVLTRPVRDNGYGATGARATADWEAVTSTVDVLDETPQSRRLLASLVATDKAAGKQVHDCALAAVAISHGATALVTANPRHFTRFADLIEIEALN